jgi:UDP-N-acetylglucosamine transferase subunit ALG13
MIFVTVGTHEQSFIRLVQCVDILREKGVIKEEVFIQTGYTDDYKPKFCESKQFLEYNEMQEFFEKARIVITHGGPGSIMTPFKLGKVPVVVPRNPKKAEHVDEHQILFTRKLEELKKVIPVYDIELLQDVIENYDIYESKCNINSENTLSTFVSAFEKEVEELVSSKKKRNKGKNNK